MAFDWNALTLAPALVSRNIRLDDHRTSIRLEPEMWDALAEIASLEGETVHGLCSRVDEMRGELGRTAAIRVFIVTYYRSRARLNRRGKG
ncbi:MAG: ribbon-helix-helix domain-containing protein [Alphaproteobacteria bacterium]